MLKKFKKRPWFRAKRFGWGWYPATWEGWAIMIAWLAIVLFIVSHTVYLLEKTPTFIYSYTIEMVLLIAPLIFVCYLTGEKPYWSWGVKKKKKKSSR